MNSLSLMKTIPNFNTSNRGDISILVVEDNHLNMEIIAATLTNALYKVTRAEDGVKALALLEQAPTEFQLVLTDKIMPNLDGLALFARMKQHQLLRKIPVIMQTGSTQDHHVSEGINAGVYYYLTKPYGTKALLSIVESALKEYQQQRFFEQYLRDNKQALGHFTSGELNFSSLEEAEHIAFFLSNLFPASEQLSVGLYEMMVNAIEHGNAGITYDEKTDLLANNEWEKELKRRLSLPQNAQKKVRIKFSNTGDEFRVHITDEGPGFNWEPYMKIEPSRATDNHGRGIAKANLLCFDKVEYSGNGNSVCCIMRRKR